MLPLALLLKPPDYQPLLPKLEAHLAKEHHLKLSSVFFQFNSVHKDDHLVYRFQRAEPSPDVLEVRTTFYTKPIVKSQLDECYSVPYIPAPFTIPGAVHTEVPVQQWDGGCLRLVLKTSVVHILFESGFRTAHPAFTAVEVDSQLKELESIAKHYVEEEISVFPRLKQAEKTIDIRYAPKLPAPGNTTARS